MVLSPSSLADRRRTADRVFRGALIFNTALTLFWAVMLATQGNAYFFTAYSSLDVANPSPKFATMFLQEHLFDAVVASWIFLAFYYSDGFLAAAFYGAQSRVMDGVLARANCLLITSLWTVFKFVTVPIGARLASIYRPAEFAVVFALIWGSYMITDTAAEVGGVALRHADAPRLGHRRHQSQVDRRHGVGVRRLPGLLPVDRGRPRFAAALVGLAVVIAVSNTLLELFSPRGTDDFTMATANALVCWAFGALVGL